MAAKKSKRVLTPVNSEYSDEAIIPETHEWFPLPEPYAHMKIFLWVDFPNTIQNMFPSVPGETPAQANERLRNAAKQVVLDHNNWKDRKGVLPKPDTDEFWERVPTRVAVQIFRLLNGAVQMHPTSARTTSTNSADTSE